MNAPFDVSNSILETERLLLRPWKQDDLNDLFAYASVPGVGEAAGWNHHENIGVSQEILDRFINRKKTYALVYKQNGTVIGSLGVELYGCEDKFTEFDGYLGREIGYVLSKDYWGQGLMTEAVRAVIDYLFNELGYDFLLCGHYDENDRSRRVQEKCGFVPYRRLVFETRNGERRPGVLTLLMNPKKDVKLVFSHPETLVYGARSEDELKNLSPKELIDRGICPTCLNRSLGGAVYGDDHDLKLYTDEDVEISFVPNPRSKGHLIIASISHYQDFSEAPDYLNEKIMRYAKMLSNALKDIYGCVRVYLCTMCDGPMNHYHVQLIPRYSNEERGSGNFVKPRQKYEFDRAKFLALQRRILDYSKR